MSASQDDDAAEPMVVESDDIDTVAATRPLPEPDLADQERASPELLPTIGHVGRYALKYCIGEGGLGTVYAAHDPLLSRLIAIKTLHIDLPEQDREQFNALFLNEAKAAGSLNHPHIVTVYDAGAGTQGAYIAMELLQGKDLRQLLAIGWRPTPGQAALIARRVADALAFAHHKGVIHRDIKPANIFMVGRTQPRVLDFGIARIRQAESQASDGLSRFGELVGGSPHYMSPEQIRREAVDRRADVYSLGVVLYELLTGRKPYTGSDLDEIADAVLNKQAPAPHELNPDVPPSLSEITLRAMNRDLALRTRSARMLSQELRVWIDTQQTEGGAKPAGKVAGSRASGKADKLADARADRKQEALDGSAATPLGSPSTQRPMLIAGVAVAAIGALAAIAWGVWGQGGQSAQPAASAASEPVGTASLPLVATPAVLPAAAQPQPPIQASQQASAASPGAPFAALQQAPQSQVFSAPASAPAAAKPNVQTSASVGPGAVAPATTQIKSAMPKDAVPAAAKPVAPEPKALPTGTVRLAISPWGQVFVGRKAMGVTPPLTQITLPQGKHTITVRNDDFPAYTEVVEVKPGQAATVSHTF